MKSNLEVKKNSNKIIETMENERVKFEVFERESLKGTKSVEEAAQLYFIEKANIKLRSVKITVDNSSIVLEPGALHYSKGDFEIKSNAGGVAGFGKKLFTSAVTGENIYKPVYKGTGEIYLEPTFGHFALIELENEEIVVDDGVFYACESTIDVGVSRMKNLSSAVLGNEGLFQVKLSGTGIVLLEIPVPSEEIEEFELNNETLKVDGNFVILRDESIEFTVQKATKNFFSSATSGEGFLNVYKGKGKVWLLPTEKIYDRLKQSGLSNQTDPGGSSNTKTKTK